MRARSSTSAIASALRLPREALDPMLRALAAATPGVFGRAGELDFGLFERSQLLLDRFVEPVELL
jgi:hypothetical protein